MRPSRVGEFIRGRKELNNSLAELRRRTEEAETAAKKAGELAEKNYEEQRTRRRSEGRKEAIEGAGVLAGVAAGAYTGDKYVKPIANRVIDLPYRTARAFQETAEALRGVGRRDSQVIREHLGVLNPELRREYIQAVKNDMLDKAKKSLTVAMEKGTQAGEHAPGADSKPVETYGRVWSRVYDTIRGAGRPKKVQKEIKITQSPEYLEKQRQIMQTFTSVIKKDGEIGREMANVAEKIESNEGRGEIDAEGRKIFEGLAQTRIDLQKVVAGISDMHPQEINEGMEGKKYREIIQYAKSHGLRVNPDTGNIDYIGPTAAIAGGVLGYLVMTSKPVKMAMRVASAAASGVYYAVKATGKGVVYVGRGLYSLIGGRGKEREGKGKGLERKVNILLIAGIVGLLGSIFFSSLNITGAVIGADRISNINLTSFIIFLASLLLIAIAKLIK